MRALLPAAAYGPCAKQLPCRREGAGRESKGYAKSSATNRRHHRIGQLIATCTTEEAQMACKMWVLCLGKASRRSQNPVIAMPPTPHCARTAKRMGWQLSRSTSLAVDTAVVSTSKVQLSCASVARLLLSCTPQRKRPRPPERRCCTGAPTPWSHSGAPNSTAHVTVCAHSSDRWPSTSSRWPMPGAETGQGRLYRSGARRCVCVDLEVAVCGCLEAGTK